MPGVVCVQYFPVIMNELMTVMGSSGKDVASAAAFKAMMIVLSKYECRTYLASCVLM